MLQQLTSPRISQLSTYLFGMLSVYVIYTLIYERLVMFPFHNNKTGQTEYQQEAGGLVFFQQLFSWICIEVFAYFKMSKSQNKGSVYRMSWKKTWFFAIIKLIALVLFTEGLYATNFRFAIVVRSGMFVAGSILGIGYSTLGGNLVKKPKIIDIVFGLLVLGGMILFWVYDPQICYYVPIQPRVIGTVMIILSLIVEGVLSIMQSQFNQTHQISYVHMLRDISLWSLAFSYGYLLIRGKFTYSVEYSFKHLEYLVEVAVLGIFFFLGQLILCKAAKNLQQNAPAYLMSAAMVLMVQVSFAFSVHKYHMYQVIGLLMAWIGVGAAFVVWAQKEDANDKITIKGQIPYDQIEALQNQDGDR